MLNFLVSLKQKDLSAMSAQQMLQSHPISTQNGLISPVSIDRYEMIHLDYSGEIPSDEVISHIEQSYIFWNPSKHRLILTASDLPKVQHGIYFNVYRKTPLHLSSKADQLQQLIPNLSLQHVTSSDIWAMHFSTPINASDIDAINHHWVVSSKPSEGLFCHPLIHECNALQPSELAALFNE